MPDFIMKSARISNEILPGFMMPNEPRTDGPIFLFVVILYSLKEIINILKLIINNTFFATGSPNHFFLKLQWAGNVIPPKMSAA